MDETAVRQYALNHPEDPLWPIALEEQELTKLLSTYIGRLTDQAPKPRSEWKCEPKEPSVSEDDSDILF
jgi:hypothetical protein